MMADAIRVRGGSGQRLPLTHQTPGSKSLHTTAAALPYTKAENDWVIGC